jgi:ribonuclease E
MLENEPDTSSTPGASEAPTTTQPRRRRAASRPAGPPATAGDAPAIVVAAPVTSEPGTTPQPTPSVEAATPAEQPAAADGATPAESDPAPAAKATKRAPAKRAPRKSAAKKAAATADEPAQPGSGDVTEAALVRTRAPRKRAAKKTAASPTDAPAEPQAAGQSAPAHPAQTDPSMAPVEAAPSPQAVEGPTEAHDTTPAASAPAEHDAGLEQSVRQDTASAEYEGEEDELTALTKRLWADPFSVTGLSSARPETDRTSEDSAAEEQTADQAPAVDVSRSDAEQADGAQSVTEQADTGQPETEQADTEQVGTAQAGDDQADDDQTDDAADSDDTEDARSESAEGDESPRRRRRRRGGRRHRRGGGEEDSTEDSNEQDPEFVADEAAPAEAVVPDSEQAEVDEAEPESESEDESEGQRRRRRRRRRRGEESSAAADDPTEVVVRVREPRARKKASQEVTGIEGSTRMEAKRQRRRDGREAGRRRAPILNEAEFLARRESVARKMIIRQHEDLSQIAVTEDGILVEHYVDRDSAASLIGNVYLGRVQNVLPSMEAAFIDIGRGRNAVLYAGEVDWDSFGAEGHNRKVEKVLKSGQTILVQVSKDPVGAKGARLTNHVSIPGRYIVYAPGGHLSGISRKLPENERRRLKDILADLVGESASVIVRTAAEGASEEELVRDVNRLKAQWEDIERKVKAGNAPQQLYGEPDLTVRIVRDLFTEDFTELVIQGNGLSNDAYDAVEGYVSHVAPHLQDRLRRWDPEEDGDIFAAHRLDEQIAKALERKVFLPSGGSLIIERTEAMTVIDVNTGKFTGTGGNLEATVTSNNLEAAEEIVRQLRLRDIGGIIVIDFIDMVLPNNRELLLRRLVECLGRDRTRHQVAEVTSLGLVQMTRKKIGTGLLEAFSTECPHCHGRGSELHDMPVDSQTQADGGAREPRPRDQRRGGNGQGNAGRQDGGRQDAGRPEKVDAAADSSEVAESTADSTGGERSQRSRRGRRGRGGSGSNEPNSGPESSGEESSPQTESQDDRSQGDRTQGDRTQGDRTQPEPVTAG